MTYGRFEFDIDFSSKISNSNEHPPVNNQDDAAAAAYQKGFDDGQHIKLKGDHEQLLEIFKRVEDNLADLVQWRKEYAERITQMLVPALDSFVEYKTKNISIESALDRNVGGIRSMLDELSAEADLKIHISDEQYIALTQNGDDEILNKLPPVVADQAIKAQDFEIRWQTGGAIFKSDDLLENYRSILNKYRKT